MDPMNGLPAIQLASGDLRRPNWSADGKRVFVIRFTANTIESMPAEGGTPLEVFRGPKDQPISDAIELPDRTILWPVDSASCRTATPLPTSSRARQIASGIAFE